MRETLQQMRSLCKLIRLWVVCNLRSARTSDERDLCNNHHMTRCVAAAEGSYVLDTARNKYAGVAMGKISMTRRISSRYAQTLPIIMKMLSSSPQHVPIDATITIMQCTCHGQTTQPISVGLVEKSGRLQCPHRGQTRHLIKQDAPLL